MAVSPSRKSSPLISNFSLASRPESSAYFFSVRVSARRKPVRCVPPSIVLMLLTYEWTFSEKLVLYCIATSTGTPSFSVSM